LVSELSVPEKRKRAWCKKPVCQSAEKVEFEREGRDFSRTVKVGETPSAL
jgi:hypothetical protein